MKATQSNAAWVSNTYQQGSAEDNWAKMGVRYRVPRNFMQIASSSTTELKILSPTNAIANGDNFILYNSTDGYTDYTVTGVSTEFPPASNANMKDLDGTGSETILTSKTWFDSTEEELVGWNPDGSKCYTYDNTGVVRQYTPPRNWDVYGASGEGCTIATTYSLDYNGNTAYVKNYVNTVWSHHGLYFFMFNAQNHKVYRWTLTTAFDLSTAGAAELFEAGAEGSTNDLWIGLLYGANASDTVSELATGGFSGLRFSEDGKKGIFIRRTNSQSGSSTMPENLAWSFELSRPYDLDSVTSAKYNNINFSSSTNRSINHAVISLDGRIIYGFDTSSSANAVFRRVTLTTPWDVTGGAGNASITISSSNYRSSNNYAFPCHITISPDGQYVSISNQSYLLRHYAAETEVMWPRTVMNITSASQSVAPTKAFTTGENVSGISYVQLTRAAAGKEDQPLAISKQSTGTSLDVFPPMDYQGSTALNSQLLSIDGTSFTTSTATHADNTLSLPANPVTSSNNPNTKGANIETYGTFVGLYQYDDPSARPANSPQYYYHAMGMQFNGDGTKFFVSGYQDNPNFSALGGPSNAGDDVIVEWDLSTPWDISTKSYANVHRGDYLKGAPTEPSTNYECLDFQFKNDGTKMYVMHNSSGNGYIFEGDLSTPYDISTWSYSHHIKLFGSDGVLDEDYTYSFGISEDGMAMKVFRSNTTGDLTSESNTKSDLITFATPWSLASVSDGGAWSAYRAYRGCLTGDSSYGYACYNAQRFVSSFSGQNMSVASLSGDRTQKDGNADQAIILSSVENYSSTASAPGKTIIVDGGTKMYIHFPLLHSVMMFTGPFGNFQDKYTIDISSLSLTEQPKDVRFGTNSTYTALPSGSATTTNDQYAEYTVADQSVNAEALRFKIEGDTGAEVTRFNVDLST